MALIAIVGSCIMAVSVGRFAYLRHDRLHRAFAARVSIERLHPMVWTGPLFLGLVLIFLTDLKAELIWTFSWAVYSWRRAIQWADGTRRARSLGVWR